MSGFDCNHCNGDVICLCGIEERMDKQPSRRERIATAVLAGLFTHNSVEPALDQSGAARMAVRAADALIAELDRKEER
jgi:hypothetical protein